MVLPSFHDNLKRFDFDLVHQLWQKNGVLNLSSLILLSPMASHAKLLIEFSCFMNNVCP